MTDAQITVLAVDDEPNNLRALKLDLEDTGYNVLTAKDGAEGWAMFNTHRAAIKVVLLDRMMPNMDGMEFIRLAKADPAFSGIPIIMQTAAAEQSQVIEGIQAGVYYYLTKPYDKDIMLSVVKAAVSDYGSYRELRNELKLFKSMLHLVRDSNFEAKTKEDVHHLSTFVAQFFPAPEQVVFGIHELLLNAIEHGNLGISYHEKTELLTSGTFETEIKRRQALPENVDKKVFVSYKRDDQNITLIIKDEGKGFDWKEYLDISPERAMHNHGRGIALSRMMSFDGLEYRGCGNEVMCRINLAKAG